MCVMSHVMCHMLGVTCQKKIVDLVGGGLFSMGPTRSSLFTIQTDLMYYVLLKLSCHWAALKFFDCVWILALVSQISNLERF